MNIKKLIFVKKKSGLTCLRWIKAGLKLERRPVLPLYEKINK